MSPIEIDQYAAEFEAFQARFARLFARSEPREAAVQYLRGLLARVPRKNCWQMAEATGARDPQSLQRLLFGALWDAEAARDELQDFVVERFGQNDGIGIVDETGFLKKGTKSAGVKRQYCGTAGKIENCQVGGFLTYCTGRGYTFLDRRLYLPQEWCQDPTRQQSAHVPEEVSFQTKSQLAAQMLAHAWTRNVPMEWVTGDEIYGDDAHLRDLIAAAGQKYVLAVAANTSVWREAQPVVAPCKGKTGRPRKKPRLAPGAAGWEAVSVVAAALPAAAWQRLAVGQGEKGPRTYDWAAVRIREKRGAVPGPESWLLARRVIFRVILVHELSPMLVHRFSPKLVHWFSPKLVHQFSPKGGQSFSPKVVHGGSCEASRVRASCSCSQYISPTGGTMPGKRSETMDVREILRHLRAKESDRAVARATKIDRKTVARYRTWATEQELLTGPLPTLGELQRLLSETMEGPPPPQNESSVEPYRDLVVKLRREKTEMTAIWERLKERGYTGSYSAVYRFVRRLEPLAPEVTVRIETKPGEEAQVDFGSVGLLIDPATGELRKAYAFVMTLSWSRHQYVEFVFDQSVATWLRLHRNAFAFFGGVVERVVTDNLKAAVVRACWTEPEAQQSYRECAEHYGFLIGPCRPYTPQHKGKVESGVHYVQRNFMGGREPSPLPQTNRDVQRWVLTTAGMRLHGTTHERPLLQFDLERAALRPLPATPYDLAIWKQAKLHRDCYVVFENAYYSAPFRLVGQLLWVRGGCQDVQLFTPDYQLVATHPRAQRPGQRLTQLVHLPPEKLPGLLLDREECRRRAMAVGVATQTVIDRLLDHRPEDRLRSAARLLRMLDQVSPLRLEAACARALRFDDISYVTIKRILEHGLENEDLPEAAPAASTACFERSVEELVGDLLGGAQWN